ncbi:MAG: RNA polymerase factor sigma-32 [Desulfovibrionaceae bacterium]|nr:RNA polymerase factor sigma-32 [Desulfovibrionaceae bacterium]
MDSPDLEDHLDENLDPDLEDHLDEDLDLEEINLDEAESDQRELDDIIDIDSTGQVLHPQLGIDEEADQKLPVPSKSRLPQITGAKDALYLYLREISKFPLLEPEEEHELALRVKNGNDPDAAFKLVSSHLRLVVRIAMDFQRRWMQNVLDLIQEGNVGLMRAINKFDPDKGIKFSYYASFWIKAYILKFIMDNWRMVKIGTTQVQRKLFFNLNKERQKLLAQGFDPDTSTLSKRLGVSKDQIDEMNQRMSFSDMSLNAKLDNDNDSATRMDLLPALEPGIEDTLATSEIVKIVRSRIKTILPLLNEKEQYILENRLLSEEPVTLREIGDRYKITRERVRQLEARLLQKIKKHFAGDLKDFSNAWIQ